MSFALKCKKMDGYMQPSSHFVDWFSELVQQIWVYLDLFHELARAIDLTHFYLNTISVTMKLLW